MQMCSSTADVDMSQPTMVFVDRWSLYVSETGFNYCMHEICTKDHLYVLLLYEGRQLSVSSDHYRGMVWE